MVHTFGKVVHVSCARLTIHGVGHATLEVHVELKASRGHGVGVGLGEGLVDGEGVVRGEGGEGIRGGRKREGKLEVRRMVATNVAI